MNETASLYRQYELWAKRLAVSVFFIALLALGGWQFHIGLLKRVLPDTAAMNPVTALLFLCCSVSFLLLFPPRPGRAKKMNAFILAGLVLTVALLKIAFLLLDMDIHIDRMLFSAQLNEEPLPNRMAPNTAFSFLLSGLALLALHYETSNGKMPAQYLALAIALLSLMSLLGYFYQAHTFYGMNDYVPMALLSGVCFLFFSAALLLAHPGKGVMREFSTPYAGSIVARRLVPVAILVPAVLGLLRLVGHWRNFYSIESGTVLLMLAIIIIFIGVIRYNAVLLNRRDAARRTAEDQLLEMNAELEKRVEQKTKDALASERRYRLLIENNEEGISLSDAQLRPFYRSPSADRLTGWSIEERQHMNAMDQIHPEDAANFRKVMDEMLAHPGKPYDLSFRTLHKNGKYIWLEGTVVNMLHEESLKAVVTTLRDVSQRKKTEVKLLKSFREVMDYKYALDESAIVSITDQQGIIRHVNDNFCWVSQYSHVELIGQNHRIVNSGYHPKALMQDLWTTIMNGKIWQGELRNKAKNGTYYWVDTTIVPFLDDEGKPYQYVAISADLTQRKKAEEDLRLLNEELDIRVRQRTEELEAFSYSVSHDLRAPLRAINGYAKMLEEDYGSTLDAEGQRLLSVVQNNARRMGVLIDDLLAFSRLGRKPLKLSAVNMNDLMSGVLYELNRTTPNHASIICDNLYPAMVDQAMMTQVLVNLLSNAVKYSSRSEHPQVHISSEKKDGMIIYTVRDNGVGFEMEYADKLFKVFQRLHSSDDFEGTGVGLAIVARIIDKHGGKVWAESMPGEGASFHFSLPDQASIQTT